MPRALPALALATLGSAACLGGSHSGSTATDAAAGPPPERDAGPGPLPDAGPPPADAGSVTDTAADPDPDAPPPLSDTGGGGPDPVDSGPPAPDASPPADTGQPPPPPEGFCEGRLNGAWCDGDDLVVCRNDQIASRTPCPHGCRSMPVGTPDRCEPEPGDDAFCAGKLNGAWCNGDDLVMCRDDEVASRTPCPAGCRSMPLGSPDRCADVAFCTDVPPMASPDPPDAACSHMDWELSPDGFYLVSRFGTTNDETTLGRSTTCGFLQGHYDGHGCRWDNRTGACVGGDHDIPWVQGHVDYDYEEVLATVDRHLDGDVPEPSYFYVAGAQRYGCGALLRVSNSENGRCVVVYAEDGGPGTRYEYADRGGRRILDASPAVVRYLAVRRWGWASSTLLLVEWGLPGDVPGQACEPCGGEAAAAGSEARRSPWDVEHMMPAPCR